MSLLATIKTPIELGLSANIKEWHKAQLFTGVDGDLKSVWNDISGNGNDFVQASLNYQPSLRIESDGFKCLEIDGSTPYPENMDSLNSLVSNVDETVICVLKSLVNAGINFCVVRSNISSPDYNQVVLKSLTITSISMDHAPTSYVAGAGRQIVTFAGNGFEKHVFVFQRRASSSPLLRMWYNKKYIDGPFTNTIYPSAYKTRLGTTYTNNKFNIYERIVIDKFCSIDEVNALIRYVASANGVQI